MIKMWARRAAVESLAGEVARLQSTIAQLRHEVESCGQLAKSHEVVVARIAEMETEISRMRDAESAIDGERSEIARRLSKVEEATLDHRKVHGAMQDAVRSLTEEMARWGGATMRFEQRLALHVEEADRTGRALLERIEATRSALRRSSDAGDHLS